MRIVDLLNIANDAYPNGQLQRYYDAQTGDFLNGWGDSLAYMLVGMLRHFARANPDTQSQLNAAIRGVQDKINVLTEVQRALVAAKNADLEARHESYPTYQRPR